MKHFMLKFNAGVEIDARLAYIGHFDRTGEEEIGKIIYDERIHRLELERILDSFGEKPSKIIDQAFTVVGNIVQFSCKFCPLWSLDFVARTMEAFAVFNYVRLSRVYPEYKDAFGTMAMVEENHGRYFKRTPSKQKSVKI